MNGTLIVRPTIEQEREAVPCHVLALHALGVALQRHLRWIRVDRRGHACTLGVPELSEHVQRHPLSVPRCLIMGERAHRAAGTPMEWRRPNWPGASLQSDVVLATR